MIEIPLTKGVKAIIDDCDAHLLKWEWYAANAYAGYYAAKSLYVEGQRGIIYLHHAILGRSLKGLFVDHINGDKLDNRRFNLRWVTKRQNCQNRPEHRKGRLLGAKIITGSKRWGSAIIINRKTKWLGYFGTEREAHNAYMKALSEIGQTITKAAEILNSKEG